MAARRFKPAYRFQLYVGPGLISTVGFLLIGFVSFAYCIFEKNFAEICIRLPFLDFPIFAGEIALAVSLFILFIYWGAVNQKFGIWHYLLFIFYVFVLAKTALGYFRWGPLALRHAALFYYPLFSVLAYYFYRRGFFNTKRIVLFSLLLITVVKSIHINDYFILTCLLFAIIIIKACPSKPLKLLFFVILLLVIPYRLFFQTARTMIVGNLAAGIFIIFVITVISRIKLRFRVLICISFLAFLSWGIFLKIDKSNLRTCTSINELLDNYKDRVDYMSIKEVGFKPKKLRLVKLYNPDAKPLATVLGFRFGAKPDNKMQKSKEAVSFTSAQRADTDAQVEPRQLKDGSNVSIRVSPGPGYKGALQESGRGIVVADSGSSVTIASGFLKPRDLEGAYNNIFFRIFIWKDMIKDIITKKPFFGFDFGMPFRSRSLEILGWGKVDWVRDGWVASHNGYLDIIYRAGIVGFIFILFIFFVFFKMIKEAIRLKSINGILLCGILINWLIGANSLEFLQLPYTAIPIWSIFGLTLAYIRNIEKQRR